MVQLWLLWLLTNRTGGHIRRKIEICRRAYHILIDKAGFAPSDIIFDPMSWLLPRVLKSMQAMRLTSSAPLNG
jgi:cobalamin-dependent methionine synthase I